MSSKRFGKKPKKPKEKASKDDESKSGKEKRSIPATKAASTQQKHFQRRTSG
ncbi:MAG: hypothetical protein K8I27_16255 [Planctomycetes bacterium]|nr:hypothetical protein [Planctomycetota bacterium]